MAASDLIYRRAALERLSSPEQLDQLVGLTSPLAWLSAAALAALLALAGVWSLEARLPETVRGEGLVVARGGQIVDAMAEEGGVISTIAEVGRKVAKGDIVATLDDSQWREALDHARDELVERQADRDLLAHAFDAQAAARARNQEAMRANLKEIVADAEQRRDFYRDLIAREAAAVASGAVTARTREDNRREMTLAEQAAGQARGDLLKLEAEEIDFCIRRDRDLAGAQERIGEARRRVEEASLRRERGAKIVAAIGGVVTETKAVPGAVVAAGRPLLSIGGAGETLELLLYVPAERGKSVHAGMEARIVLSAFPREQYGALEGRVVSVSDYPVTREGMVSQLQNEQLAQSFLRDGPAYAVRVALVSDPATPSGYRWTGGKGPSTLVTSGATATAEIVAGRHAPAYYALPALERWLRHD